VNGGVNIPPLGAQFTPRDEVFTWGPGVKLRMAFRVPVASERNKNCYLGSPSELPGDPADFRFAVGAPDPVTAPFLQKNDLAARALERVALRYQTLCKKQSFCIKVSRR
jgi:hypothetical protein